MQSSEYHRLGLATLLAAGLLVAGASLRAADLWPLAREHAAIHRFSTLFTAQDVRRSLADDAGIDEAIDWCKRTAVTHVYVETFRDGYQADRSTLDHARDRLRAAGLSVSGCITTTRIGKRSTGWDVISCYTDLSTQKQLQDIFEFAAGLFDEIMIDDFWFTDCQCEACDAGRRAQKVVIGEKSYPVVGESWEDYRCELMVRLSQDRVLGAARRVNPAVKLIIKYPQWYDRFHERGYEVVRQTADFDKIWVGTETRDYHDRRWGGTVQYEAYFIMRWLGGIGGQKCGGGWYDWLGTTERTYVEQARQTILAGARESMLFCYGGLHRDTGPKNVETLREHLPELFAVAKQVRGRRPIGIAAYKPPNSHPENEARVFDFVGMLGLPLVPMHVFPAEAPAAFFSVHALENPEFKVRLRTFVESGRPVLVTDGLAARLGSDLPKDPERVHVLEVKGDPKSLLEFDASALEAVRRPFLATVSTTFRAPNQVALYLFQDGSWVIENFRDDEAQVELDGRSLIIPARGWKYEWK